MSKSTKQPPRKPRNKGRPNKRGALWWSQAFTDYHDSVLRQLFPEEVTLAQGFHKGLRALITQSHDTKHKTYKVTYSMRYLLGYFDDERIDEDWIVQSCGKLLESGYLSDFKVTKVDRDRPTEIEFGEVGLLKYFDTYTLALHRQESYLEDFRNYLEHVVLIKNKMNDSTQDECVEYAKVKKFGKKKQRENQESNITFDDWIKQFEENRDKVEEESKDNAPIPFR